jgi:hypothetical protein
MYKEISGKQLYDDSYFKKIHVISNGKGIEWEHGQDIVPHELYDMSVLMNVDV